MTVVVILSHGKDGLVYAADGQSIDMEYIYEFFNNRNCPYLQVENLTGVYIVLYNLIFFPTLIFKYCFFSPKFSMPLPSLPH